MSKTLAVLALTLALNLGVSAGPAHAQFGGMGGGGPGGRPSRIMMSGQRQSTAHPSVAYSVGVTTSGGQSVSGAMTLGWVVVDCELGCYEVEPDKVKEIRFTPLRNGQVIMYANMMPLAEGTVVTSSGLEISGNVLVENWKLRTDLGVVTLNAATLKTLTFKGRAADQPIPESKPRGEPKAGNAKESSKEAAQKPSEDAKKP